MVKKDTVTLRALTRRDLEAIRRWGNDPEVASLLDRVRPISELEHSEWFAKIVKDPTVYLFGIEEVASKKFVGNIWLYNTDPRHRKAELRIFIGDKASWGKGYGKQALSQLVKFGFKKLNLHKIYAYVLETNPRSKKMFESCGFRVEGTFKDEHFYEGKYVDGYRLGIIRKK